MVTTPVQPPKPPEAKAQPEKPKEPERGFMAKWIGGPFDGALNAMFGGPLGGLLDPKSAIGLRDFSPPPAAHPKWFFLWDADKNDDPPAPLDTPATAAAEKAKKTPGADV